MEFHPVEKKKVNEEDLDLLKEQPEMWFEKTSHKRDQKHPLYHKLGGIVGSKSDQQDHNEQQDVPPNKDNNSPFSEEDLKKIAQLKPGEIPQEYQKQAIMMGNQKIAVTDDGRQRYSLQYSLIMTWFELLCNWFNSGDDKNPAQQNSIFLYKFFLRQFVLHKYCPHCSETMIDTHENKLHLTYNTGYNYDELLEEQIRLNRDIIKQETDFIGNYAEYMMPGLLRHHAAF
jgi:hypothetical protein